MTAVLRSIAYVSSAAWVMSDADLETLLASASDLNLQNDVTGVLLYAGGNFMQYFEGPPLAVGETYQRIKVSQRHRDVIELMDEPLAERLFPDWQIALAQPTRSELLAMTTATWTRASSRGRLTAVEEPLGLKLLTRFWEGAMHSVIAD